MIGAGERGAALRLDGEFLDKPEGWLTDSTSCDLLRADAEGLRTCLNVLVDDPGKLRALAERLGVEF